MAVRHKKRVVWEGICDSQRGWGDGDVLYLHCIIVRPGCDVP